MEPEEIVFLSANEYKQLIWDSDFLQRLRAAGVDNWEGYHYGFPDNEED